MWERHKLFFGLRLLSKDFQNSAIQTKIEQHFFHQIKVRQPKGRQDSMQTMIRTSRRLNSLFTQNFEIFSNIQERNLKIKNL